MKKAIITVSLGDYDGIPRPPAFNHSWDRFLYTDQEIPRPVRHNWTDIIQMPKTDRPDLASRYVKWMSHEHLPDYDLVTYVDGNIRVIKELPEMPFMVKHPKRSSVLEEAEALKRLNHRWSAEGIDRQLDVFDMEGFTDDRGLFLNGFFCRRHDEKMNHICHLLYAILIKHTSRDQLSLPFCLWAADFIPENIVDYKFMREHTRMHLHKEKKPKIYG